MTIKRLEALKKKFNDGTGDTQDLGEILVELFQSVSSHMKDVKQQMAEIQGNHELLQMELEEIKTMLNPVYTIMLEDDEE